MKKMRVILLWAKKQDSVFGKLLSGAFWSVVGNTAVKGLALLAGIFVARFLGSGEFGELSIIKSNLSLFGLLASFGLGFTITKWVSEKLPHGFSEIGKIVSAGNLLIISMATLFSALLWFFSPTIAVLAYKSESLTPFLRFSTAFLFLNAVNTYQLGLMAGLRLFKKTARVNVILGLVSFPVMIGLSYYYGLEGTLLAMIISMGFGVLLNRGVLVSFRKKNGIVVCYKNVLKDVRPILFFSLPLAVRELIHAGGNWLIYFFLLSSANFNEVGIFNSANQLSQIILFLPGAILGVTLSFLSAHKSDSEQYGSLIKKSLTINLLITLVMGTIMFLSTDLIYGLYGKSYDGGQSVLLILIVATIPMSMISILEQVSISSSKPQIVTLFNFFGQVIMVSATLVFLKTSKSAVSVAYAYLLGYLCYFAGMFLYLKKRDLLW